MKRVRFRFSIRTMIACIGVMGSLGAFYFDYDPWKKVGELRVPGEWINSISISENNLILSIIDGNDVTRFWEIKSLGKSFLTIPSPGVSLNTINFMGSSGKAVVAGYQGYVCIIDTNSGVEKVLSDNKPTDIVHDIEFLKRTNKFITINHLVKDGQNAKNCALLWDIENGITLRNLIGHDGFINATTACEVDNKVITCGTDSLVCVWDAQSAELISILKGHASNVWGCSLSPSEKRLATFGDDGVMVWDLNQGSLIRKFTQHSGRVNSAAFVSENEVLSSGDDGDCYVFDLGEPTPLQSFKGKYFRASKDGSRAVVWDEGNVRIVDIASGCILFEFPESASNSRPGSFMAISIDLSILAIYINQRVHVYQRFRPEYWWGVVKLPSFWLLCSIAGIVGVCIVAKVCRVPAVASVPAVPAKEPVKPVLAQETVKPPVAPDEPQK